VDKLVEPGVYTCVRSWVARAAPQAPPRVSSQMAVKVVVVTKALVPGM